MLRKLGATLVAVGLFLPYSPDVRVIASVWHNAAEVLFQGFPVLLAFVYVLHTLVPAFARFDQRHGQRLHGALRMVYFVLVGAYLATATAGRAGGPAPRAGASPRPRPERKTPGVPYQPKNRISLLACHKHNEHSSVSAYHHRR